MSIQKIKTDTNKRVETGAVQFDDDWPGLFIRGDDALYFGKILEWVIPCIKNCPDVDKAFSFMYTPILNRFKNIIDEDVSQNKKGWDI